MNRLIAVLAGCVAVALAAPAFAGVQELVPARQVQTLEEVRGGGGELRLERFPVGGRQQTLVLEEFSVLAPNAVIEVFDGNLKPQRVTPAPMRQFRGHIEGEPDSLVYLSTGPHADGVIVDGDRKYLVKQRRSAKGERDWFVEEVSMLDEINATPEGYACDALHQPVTATNGLVPRSLAFGVQPDAFSWPTGTAASVVNLALSTDSALYASFGSNDTAVKAYVQNLAGAASVIYRRDLRTELRIVYLQVTTSTDPWIVNPGASGTWKSLPVTFTSGHALAEFGNYWHNTPPSNLPRSEAMLLSGQSQLRGIAWIDVICGGDFLYQTSPPDPPDPVFDNSWGGSYAYCGGIGTTANERTVPDPNGNSGGAFPYQINTSSYWGLLQFSHELGHSVQSPHTHCVALSAAQKSQYGVARDFIDVCSNLEGPYGCSSATEAVPPEKGTIMSYCHIFSPGGATNSRWLFGKAGEPSELVTTAMRAALDLKTPTGLSPITAAASVNVAVPTPASVTPGVGLTYDWTITNGTLAGGATPTTAAGSAVTFTATANPVTLRVYATTAQGCGISDVKTITVVTCTAPAISTHPASTSISLGSSTSLSVVASGTSPTYQWYTGVSGNTSSPVPGGTLSSLSVSPVATTGYWVRVTNTCGTADSTAATVTVTCSVPNITTDPASVQIWSGNSTPLSVVSAGSPTLGYQWYVGASGNTSSPVGGATSASLTVTPGATTQYWVRVTNTCGTDDSLAATVTVSPLPATGALFTTVTPCRVYDSRSTTALPEGAVRNIAIGGVCGIPVSARAVAANLTAVTPASTGWFALYTGNTVWDGTSTMNYRAGKTRANNAVVPLSPDGILAIRNGGPVTHFIIDVSGYFQ